MKARRGFAILAWLACSLWLAGAAGAHPLGEPPGRLVDIGGYRVHLYCQGEGEPTILIDTGLGGTSLEWQRVMEHLSQYARVCVYDRPGYGWSDAGPAPRTSSTIVNEMYLLLEGAGLAGPFVLVGHSFGGYNVQLFARRYPYLTAGLVLVDSSHPDQVERFQAPPHNVRTVPTSRFGLVQFADAPPRLPDGLTEAGRLLALYQQVHWRPRRYIGLELFAFRDSAEELRTAQPLPPVPLVVLTRGKRVWPEGARGDGLEALWLDLQSELAAQSPTAVHLVARRSGHQIQLEQPALVAFAVDLVIDASRPGADATPVLPARWRPWADAAVQDVTWLKDTLALGAPRQAVAQVATGSPVY